MLGLKTTVQLTACRYLPSTAAIPPSSSVLGLPACFCDCPFPLAPKEGARDWGPVFVSLGHSPFTTSLQKATVKGVTHVRVVVKGLGPGRWVSDHGSPWCVQNWGSRAG